MFKIKKQLLVVAAFLSIIWTASAQVPTPTINGTPPPFTFSGPGVSQSGQNFTFSGSGTGVGSITWVIPSWLTASPTTISASGTQTFSPTISQTSHEVIGTCGSATTFAPCAPTLAEAIKNIVKKIVK